MALEQISEEKEMLILSSLKEGEEKPQSYGYIEKLKVIRDMSAFSMFSLNLSNQSLGRRIMLMSADNYPEILNKCYICNAPWVFNSIYSMIKLILPATTVAKIDMLGRNYLTTLGQEIGLPRIAAFLGGSLTPSNPSFFFDLSPAGPLAHLDVGQLMTSTGDDRLEQQQDIKWGNQEQTVVA